MYQTVEVVSVTKVSEVGSTDLSDAYENLRKEYNTLPTLQAVMERLKFIGSLLDDKQTEDAVIGFITLATSRKCHIEYFTVSLEMLGQHDGDLIDYIILQQSKIRAKHPNRLDYKKYHRDNIITWLMGDFKHKLN